MYWKEKERYKTSLRYIKRKNSWAGHMSEGKPQRQIMKGEDEEEK